MKTKYILVAILLLISFNLYSQANPQYVILISLDGYRHDYTQRFNPSNISRFIEGGVEASSLIPSFPSKTFPNHYSIATGLKPENHGLVNNYFYDLDMDAHYSIGNRQAVENPNWYGGKPIWVLAEEQGLKSASYFFVGTEAAIQGIQPSYFYNYDAAIPNLTRIAKVFDWLSLPEEERPRLITLYFSDMDDVGHAYGPNNDEKLQERINKLDAQLGALFEGIKSFDLDVNIILVSDHGMADVEPKNLINLDLILANQPVRIMNNGALAHIYVDSISRKKEVFSYIQKKEKNFIIEDVEEKNHYQNIDKYRGRLGDFLILPNLGYYLVDTGGIINYQKRAAAFDTEVFGEHGYDPSYKDMHGIFYANGPAFKQRHNIPAIDNTDVFPLICRILGLNMSDEIDGTIDIIQQSLNDTE